jgi:hypothetical protein
MANGTTSTQCLVIEEFRVRLSHLCLSLSTISAESP